MLDLTQINSFYELKWFDGTILHLPKPTEKMLRKAATLDEQGLSELEQLDEMKKMTWELIRQNTDGRKFTKAELEQCDGIVCNLILTDYLKEVDERLGE